MQIIIGGGPECGKTVLAAYLRKFLGECGIKVTHIFRNEEEAARRSNVRPSHEQALRLGRCITEDVEILEVHERTKIVGQQPPEDDGTSVYCPYCHHKRPAEGGPYKAVDTGRMTFNVIECTGCHKFWIHSEIARSLASMHPRETGA